MPNNSFCIFEDTNEHWKCFLGGAINSQFDPCNLIPYEKPAFKKHVKKWLGKKQWDKLKAEFATGNSTGCNEQLLELVQQAMAWFVMYEYAVISETQLTEGGLMTVQDEKWKQASRNQALDRQMLYLTNGCECLEEMIEYLDCNRSKFSAWSRSKAGREARALFINYTEQFNEYYHCPINRCAFECIRPIMKKVECFLIERCFGEKFINYLREMNQTKHLDDLRPCDMKLLNLIKCAIVDFTMAHAMELGIVMPKGGMMTMRYFSDKKGGDISTISVISKHKKQGEELWSKVKKLLDENADKYPLYEDFCAEMCECECSCECEPIQETYSKENYYTPMKKGSGVCKL